MSCAKDTALIFLGRGGLGREKEGGEGLDVISANFMVSCSFFLLYLACTPVSSLTRGAGKFHEKVAWEPWPVERVNIWPSTSISIDDRRYRGRDTAIECVNGLSSPTTSSISDDTMRHGNGGSQKNFIC